MTVPTPHIVGLDMSLALTGWASIRPGDEVRHGTIPSAPPRSAKEDYYPETLDRIRRIVARALDRADIGRGPDDPLIVGIEGPSHGNSNEKGYHARAGLFWMIYHLIAKRSTAVVIIPPASAKRYMTGSGNADKAAMVAAVQRAFPGQLITDDNEADAMTLAAMIARQLHFPQEVSAQRVMPSALDAVPWPRWIRELD